MHNSDFYLLEQQQVQLQQEQCFWTFVGACWLASNQQRTNRILEEKLDSQNRLLEQIRRQLLTPAERAKEDAQRAAKRAREKARQAQIDKMTYTVAALVVVFGLIAVAFQSAAAKPAKQDTFQTSRAVTANFQPATPQNTGPTQAEKDANWQRILDMRRVARAPRAKLVKLPKK